MHAGTLALRRATISERSYNRSMRGSTVVLCLLAATAPAQDVQPTAPPGWSMQTVDGAWALKPDDLSQGKVFSAVITKKEKAQGDLRAYLDALWAGLGAGAKRNEKVDQQSFGSWQSLFSFGFATQGTQALAITITVYQKSNERFASITLADSAETHGKYAATAGLIVGSMLGLVPNAPPAAPSNGAPTTFQVTFPAGWKLGEQGAFKFARLDDTYDNRRFKTIVFMPPEPIQGSLEATYGRLWNREMNSGAITLRNPGIISPEKGPQPLRRRMKNGLEVLWEGGEGTMNNFDVYTQLFMVCGDSSVTPVLAVFGVGTGSILDRERAPVMQFLESFRPTAPVAQRALFTERDLVGKWQLELSGAIAGWYSASGGYLGDASTGGLENLDLNSDGSYSKLLVAKSPQLQWTHKEAGTWRVVDDKLVLTPHAGQPQTMRIYGPAILQGQLNMLMGLDDDNRIPTDALEAGCQAEMLVRGSCLFKYVRQPG